MQYGLIRLGHLSSEDARFTRAKFGDMFAKQEAIRTMFGQPQLPLALRKVRSLSGVGNYISLTNDTGPPGLGNWDNSCYQNSVLQGLASLPAFIEYMEQSLELCDIYEVSAATHRALVVFLEQLADSSCRKTVLWTPSVLKSMDSWTQQDAQEYFSRVLDAVEKEANIYGKITKRSVTAGLECLRIMNGKGPQNGEVSARPSQLTVTANNKNGVSTKLLQHEQRSPVEGMTAQGLECQTCGFTEGLSLTQFSCLTLNLGLRGPSSVEDLLDEYTAPEEVEGVECENCTKLANGQDKEAGGGGDRSQEPDRRAKTRKPVLRTKAKQITVGRLPKDLVLHINRSIFDNSGNQLKNTAPVRVPSHLNFLSRWCAPLDETVDTVEAVYELKCVVTHYGRHDDGHYVALGKRGKDWYSFNDETVTQISEEDVLARGNGFMLFYEAIPPSPPVEIAAEAEEVQTIGVDSTHDPMEEMVGAPKDALDPVGPEVAPDGTISTDNSQHSASTSESSTPLEALTDEADKPNELSFPAMRTAGDISSNAQEPPHAGAPVVSAL